MNHSLTIYRHTATVTAHTYNAPSRLELWSHFSSSLQATGSYSYEWRVRCWTVDATNHQFLLFGRLFHQYYSPILFSSSLKMRIFGKNVPKILVDTTKCLFFSDLKSKTQRYSIYNDLTQSKSSKLSSVNRLITAAQLKCVCVHLCLHNTSVETHQWSPLNTSRQSSTNKMWQFFPAV